jgi:hypothetical protein
MGSTVRFNSSATPVLAEIPMTSDIIAPVENISLIFISGNSS